MVTGAVNATDIFDHGSRCRVDDVRHNHRKHFDHGCRHVHRRLNFGSERWPKLHWMEVVLATKSGKALRTAPSVDINTLNSPPRKKNTEAGWTFFTTAGGATTTSGVMYTVGAETTGRGGLNPTMYTGGQTQDRWCNTTLAHKSLLMSPSHSVMLRKDVAWKPLASLTKKRRISAQGACQWLTKQDLDFGHLRDAAKHEGDHKRAGFCHVPGTFIPLWAGGCHLVHRKSLSYVIAGVFFWIPNSNLGPVVWAVADSDDFTVATTEDVVTQVANFDRRSWQLVRIGRKGGNWHCEGLGGRSDDPDVPLGPGTPRGAPEPPPAPPGPPHPPGFPPGWPPAPPPAGEGERESKNQKCIA